MQAFIEQPKRIPFFLKIGIWFSERITGKTMLPARFGVGSGPVRVNGALVTIDPLTGKALAIERVVRYWHE